MNDFRIVVILPGAPAGVEQTLQTALEEADKAGYELKAIVPWREGLLVVHSKEFGEDKKRR